MIARAGLCSVMDIYDRSRGVYAWLEEYMIACAGLCSVMDIYDRSRCVYARLAKYMLVHVAFMFR